MKMKLPSTASTEVIRRYVIERSSSVRVISTVGNAGSTSSLPFLTRTGWRVTKFGVVNVGIGGLPPSNPLIDGFSHTVPQDGRAADEVFDDIELP